MPAWAVPLGVAWTRPQTGVPGGRPTGPPTRIPRNEKGSERRSLELENECAETVADRGWHLRQNPTREQIADARSRTGDIGDAEKLPDYLIEGHVFDCYSPTPDKPVRGIWSEVSKKVSSGQSQRVVVNLTDWRGDHAALKKQFDDWPVPGLKELVVATPDGSIRQLRCQD